MIEQQNIPIKNVGGIFAYSRPHSNLDSYYGPYTTKEEANAKTEGCRDIGFTVGIKEFVKDDNGLYIKIDFEDEFLETTYPIYTTIDEEVIQDLQRYSFIGIEEYLYKRTVNDLEKKGESSLILLLISPSRIRTSENIPIKIQILGGITPNSIQVFEVKNEQEFSTSYSYPGIIPLNGEISLNLNMSGNPRTIIYRIKVTDKNNLFAKTMDDENYVEVIVDWKEIELYNINLNNINGLIVKNANNLLDKTFTFNVGYIDSIIDYGVDLYIGETKINEAIENLGGDYYKATIPDNLRLFEGLDISIKTIYTRLIDELETEGSNDTFIVTIMAKGIFSNILTEILGNTFYMGNKVTFKIYFEAESQETYSIISDESSDFFYDGRIMSYTWNTIYIDPVNIGNNPLFKFKLGDTKDVVITFDGKILAFTKRIFTDDTRIPDDPRTEEFKNNHESLYLSFILDIDGFINWTLFSNNLFELGNITITKDLISFGSIKYPTPLQRDIHLGFEYLVSAENTIYNALYIDGVLCKNIKLEQQDTTKIRLNNLNCNNNYFTIKNINLYFSNDKYLSPFTSINFANSNKYIPIIQNNYEYYLIVNNDNNSENNNQEELPILQLAALSLDDNLYNIRNAVLEAGGKTTIIPSKFGTLEDGLNKYVTVDSNSGDLYNILLKQRTDLKSELQKSRGVLCTYTYGSNNTGYVEVHTQGTSTLDYRLPNFKFTFLNADMTTQKVQFVPGYNESTLTAKADYMDSSHLNNTPTATYYNKIINSGFFLRNGDKRSPSSKEGGLDAITGIPIIMSIKDVDGNDFVNYGSFMLNIDKTGKALKFKVDDNIDECISFEGTSNDLNSGLSSRFQISTNQNYLNIISLFNTVNSNLNNLSQQLYYYSTSNIDDQGVEHYYIEVLEQGSSVAKLIGNETLSSPSYICRNSVLLVLFYLAEGLEYRYPDGDIISVNMSDLQKKKKSKLEIMPLQHFIRLFKMFYWVANSENLSQTDYREQFIQYYNYDYCALYFIFLMIFAQTDNLGKNCMFDLWFNPDDLNNENRDCLWYPRPYDLDSLTGLDNNGNDGIAPFIEISPRFSLNYREKDPEETLSNYNLFLELNYLKVDSVLTYPESVTNDLQGVAKRYSFSSSNSNLWFNFYKNFKNEIRLTYRDLRNYKINESLVYDSEGTFTLLSSDIILKFYKEFVLDKLGYSQYNLDFLLKYLGDIDSGGRSRLFFGLGNRWDKFSDWIEKRILFCDTYFYYREFLVELSVFNKEILLNSPQYIITKYSQGNATENVYFFNGENKVNVLISGDGTSTSGLKYSFWINPEAILEGNIYANLLTSSPKMPLDSIINLSVGGNTLSNVININNANYLQTLEINGLEIGYNNDLPSNIKNIVINNSSLFPNISNLKYLESITINNCISNSGSLTLLNLGLNTPIRLSITNSKLKLKMTKVRINEFYSEGNEIDEIDINECIIPTLKLLKQTIGTIGFSGSLSEIDIIDFRESTFVNDSLDLSIVAKRVKHLLLNDVKGLLTITTSNRFESLEFIGLMNSSLENLVYDKEGENRTIDHFDGKLLPDILPKSLYCKNYDELLTQRSRSYTQDIIYNQSNNNYYSGTAVATRSFNLEQTNITKVINLLVRDSNIVNSESNCTGVTKLFTNCRKLLSILNSDINCSGEKMFKNCSLLSDINNTTIKIGNDASYMFATCNSLSYSYISAILLNNTNILNFNSFLFNTSFSENTTINFSEYGSATNLTKAFCFCIHSESGFLLSTGHGITVTFNGTIPVNVTSIQRAFEFYTSNNFAQFTNWNNLVKDCSHLEDLRHAFFACAPSNSGFYEIDNAWLPSSNQLNITLEGTFARCRIKLINSAGSPFKFNDNIFNCLNTFHSCVTWGLSYDVSRIFENCSRLENIMGCFYDNLWATVNDSDGLALNNDASNVNILGTFATSNINNCPRVSAKITGNYTCSTNTTYSSNTVYKSGTALTYQYTFHDPLSSIIANEDGKPGTFLNRKVSIPVSESSISLSRIYTGSELYNMFRNAVITKSDGTAFTDIYVTLMSSNINRIFYNTNMLGANLHVTLSSGMNGVNGIQYANHAFRLDGDRNYYKFPTEEGVINPPKLPETLIQGSYMFYRLKIDNIPIDYFKNNGVFLLNLTNISYMFYGVNITELPYDNSYGLIPNSVTNVNYLFYNCALLRKGIPKNLFNTNTRLTQLIGVFGRTGVLFNISNDTSEIMTPFSVKKLTPNVTDVSSLFYYNYVNGMSSPQKIEYDSFENCITLNLLFMLSLETVNFVKKSEITGEYADVNEIKINSPINMARTFAGVTKYLMIDITSLDALKDMTGISHSISSNENISVPDYNNSITKSIYDLLNSLLSLIYSGNYINLMNLVSLENCFGRWEKNTEKLELFGIPSDSDYELVKYWYRPASVGTVPTNKSYITN